MLESNRNLIDSRLLITEQLIIFVKICGELNEQMNKLEMLIENEKGHLDNTVLESSRYPFFCQTMFSYQLFLESLFSNFICKFVTLVMMSRMR